MLFWRLRDLRVYSHHAMGVVAVAVITVASIAAGVRSGDTVSPRAAAAPPSNGRITFGPGFPAISVASGHGKIWLLVKAPARRFVELIDPRTYGETSAVRVSGSASHVLYGAGRLWVTGGRRISAIDPASHRIATLRLAAGTVRSMAFRGSTAYAAVVGRDEVLAIKPGYRLRAKAIDEHGGPRVVVAFPDAIEVANTEMNLVPIIFPGADTSFLAALQLGRPVIGAAGAHAAWVRRGTHLVRETLGSDNRPARKYIATPGRALRVVMTDGGGCFVSLASGRRRGVDLAYFSRQALAARHPTPTDVHVGRRVVDFALDPAGGVVYIDRTGAVRRWDPAA